ncbi:MAG: hypothetical protein JSR77_13930 [Planctomycetes bacterium]|nr:hypothetical protein [Planctomycetota bacterium]
MFKRGLVASAVAAVVLCGCNDPEAGEVEMCYSAIYHCCDSRDAECVLKLLAPASIAYYDRLLGIARTANREQVEALRPTERLEVLKMRQFATRPELAAFDASSYIRFIVSRGVWAGGEKPRISNVKVRGDTATANIRDEKGKATHHKFDFVKVDGMWKIDWNRSDDMWDEYIEKDARRERMSVNNLLFFIIEEESEMPVKADIWEPSK